MAKFKHNEDHERQHGSQGKGDGLSALEQLQQDLSFKRRTLFDIPEGAVATESPEETEARRREERDDYSPPRPGRPRRFLRWVGNALRRG